MLIKEIEEMKSGGGVGLGVVFLPEQRRDDHISQEEACHKREGNKTSRFPIKILHFNKRFKCRGLPNAIITKVGRKSEVLFYRLFTFGTFSLPIGKNKTQFFLGFFAGIPFGEFASHKWLCSSYIGRADWNRN